MSDYGRVGVVGCQVFDSNIGAETNGYLYFHEEEDEDGAAMHSFIVSADMDIGDGNEVVFVDRAYQT